MARLFYDFLKKDAEYHLLMCVLCTYILDGQKED